MAYCSYCAAVLDANQPMCLRCGQPAPGPVPTMVNARPSAVRLACVLLLVSCLISFASVASIFLAPKIMSRMPALFLARSIGLWVLWVVLTILVWQRQAWARIAILLLLAWSLGNLVLTSLRFSVAVFALAIPFLIDALRIGAAFLLFKPESNAWFKK
jgi:hypothetical protein